MAVELNDIISGAVRKALDPITVEAITVEQRRSNADEDALYVVVTLPSGTPLVGGERYVATMVAVSDALIAIGDQRFPYVRLDRAGEEAAEEPDHPASFVQ